MVPTGGHTQGHSPLAWEWGGTLNRHHGLCRLPLHGPCHCGPCEDPVQVCVLRPDASNLPVRGDLPCEDYEEGVVRRGGELRLEQAPLSAPSHWSRTVPSLVVARQHHCQLASLML